MSSPDASYRNGSTPTVLLVHGAFADASGWAGVIAALQASGIDVRAPANPLRGLASDAAYIASVAGTIDGPVLLVGHSYGGAVITVAGAQVQNVVGLVYVAAFAVDEGESAVDSTASFPPPLLSSALRPARFAESDGQVGVELYIREDTFPQVFAADLPASEMAVLAVAQRPVAAKALQEQAAAAAWKTLPSWFAVATDDNAIPPDAQRFMARRAGAQTVEITGSHSIFVSQPTAIADLIRQALAR